MEFISLRVLIYDLLRTIRASQISDDEPISERQLESWIHHYRAKLVKQDLDKGKYPNPNYIQEYCNSDGTALKLEPDELETKTVYKTELQIPNTIDLNYKYGITSIEDVEGNKIQLVPKSRINWQEYKKYTKDSTLAYLQDRYIYLHNPNDLQYIRVWGIFELPTEILGYDLDDKYPIPADKIDTLKNMILKNELGIQVEMPNDNENDSQHTLESDIKK